MNLAHKPAFLWRNVADSAEVQGGHLYVTQASFSFFNHEKKYRTWKDYQLQNDFMIKLCLVTKKYVHTIQFFKTQRQYLATVKQYILRGKKRKWCYSTLVIRNWHYLHLRKNDLLCKKGREYLLSNWCDQTLSLGLYVYSTVLHLSKNNVQEKKCWAVWGGACK